MVRSENVIKIVPGERFTPYSLAERVGARCLLESSSFVKGRERYSLLLVREAFQLSQTGETISFRRRGEEASYRVVSKARDILDVCRYFADQHFPVQQDFPFPAGGIGYLSFEFARFCDTVKFADQADPLDLPDAAFIFGHVFIVFDHHTDRLYLIGLNYNECQIDLEMELASLEALILSPQSPVAQNPDASASARLLPDESDADADYEERVRSIREEVIAGNLLQAVPSRRLTFYSEIRPLDAYRYLRSSNPSPYMFFIDFGTYQLIGASPEVHVRVKNGKAILRPIAGTRRRGKNTEEDQALESELLADPKERAEHLMLVDLGRNDLGRVCVPGTVKVEDFMIVERYSHVMHIVSQVEGVLSEGKSGIDALRATFPAGTVSGAPKIRAMEVISRLEPRKRRTYAGAIGYMEPGANLDTCIGIRSALKMGNRLVFQSGGGVVFDSTPERELEETKEKMAAMLVAFGITPDAGSESLDDTTVTVSFAAAGIPPVFAQKQHEDEVWAAAEEEERLLSAQDKAEETIALDWDFDPEAVSGSEDIQNEIDSLIESGNNPSTADKAQEGMK